MSTSAETVHVGAVRAGTANPLRQHRVLLLAVLTMAVIVAVYWPTFLRMIEMWPLLNYQHCWLVLPISLYVLWRKRHALAGTEVQGSVLGVLATALVVLTWIVSRSIGVQAVEFTAATLLIFTLFWAIAGNRAAEKASFPLLLLLAAVPVGEILVEPLMNLTANISGTLLRLSGVPALRDRTFFTLPGGSFEVADVCSGLRYLLAGAMASLAYAYVSYTSLRKRALFVGIASAILVLLNGVRAFIVMYVASATEMEVFGGADHVYFGMALFAIAFILLIFLGERYADTDPRAHREQSRAGRSSPFPAATAVVALAAVLFGPALQYAKAQQPFPDVASLQLPRLPACSGPDEWDGGWSPEFVGADYAERASYSCADLSGTVYVAGYLHQEQGKELITSINRIWPTDWRRYTEESPVTLSTDAGVVTLRQVLVQSPERSIVIWYWYQTGDTVTASPLKVKLLEAAQALAFSTKEASVTAIALSSEPGADAAALRDRIEPLAHAVMSWDRENSG